MEYKEIQKLNLWWLYILFGIQAIIILSITFLGDTGVSLEELKEIYYLPIVGVVLIFALAYFINQNYLSLFVNKDGITYKYWPFTRTKSIRWDEIDSAYLRKYDALGEYGGWGFRYRLWFKWSDKAFIFDGDSIGLQIVLKNNKKLLFSTTKPENFRQFLTVLKKGHHLLMIKTDV
ncbi:hypothetical protein [Pedobacter sp. UBA4863]|uniref:hypothetical protein n=1 Tax=Pedobacter sp. UBA4863 TaxID=1947060 RepID=UPI0025E4CAF0|nr:hypothetical protein [Pedobacter sp. UBA4863]